MGDGTVDTDRAVIDLSTLKDLQGGKVDMAMLILGRHNFKF